MTRALFQLGETLEIEISIRRFFVQGRTGPVV
jgi:hypothetical protein